MPDITPSEKASEQRALYRLHELLRTERKHVFLAAIAQPLSESRSLVSLVVANATPADLRTIAAELVKRADDADERAAQAVVPLQWWQND